jgi:hypothetical protein
MKIRNLMRWCSQLHVGQLVMLTFLVGILAAIAVLLFVGVGSEVLPCAAVGPSGFGCEGIYTVWLPVWLVLFVAGLAAFAFIGAAWWGWFGARGK